MIGRIKQFITYAPLTVKLQAVVVAIVGALILLAAPKLVVLVGIPVALVWCAYNVFEWFSEN